MIFLPLVEIEIHTCLTVNISPPLLGVERGGKEDAQTPGEIPRLRPERLKRENNGHQSGSGTFDWSGSYMTRTNSLLS